MSNSTTLFVVIFAVVCAGFVVSSAATGILKMRESSLQQSEQAIENNFKLAYELWAEDRRELVQTYEDWKKERTMELNSGIFVIKLKNSNKD